MGKGSRSRRRAQKQAAKKLTKGVTRHVVAPAGPPPTNAVRPTPERMAKGTWTTPEDRDAALMDLDHDEVARLHRRGDITDAQEASARTYQQAWADYLAEIPEVSGYRSCIDDSVPGYDDGDGDPAVIARYRRLTLTAGRAGASALWWTCALGNTPRDLATLTRALDAIDGV